MINLFIAFLLGFMVFFVGAHEYSQERKFYGKKLCY